VAEECFFVQYVLELLFFCIFFTPKQHRKIENEVNRWYDYEKGERAEARGISSLKNDS
jgi:hypothetical protein